MLSGRGEGAEASMAVVGHNSRELLKLDIVEEIVAKN